MTAVAVGAPQEPSLGTVRPGRSPRRLLAYAVVIGLVLDIGLRGGLANALITLAVGLTVRLLWTDDPRSGRPNGHEVTDRASRTSCDGLARKEARIVALAALVPALFLALRTSPWLAWSNASLIAALLAAAVIHARHGSILDSTPGQLVLRGASGVERGLQRLEVVRAVTPDVSSERRAHLRGVSRGLLVAVPVLLVLVALLASADAVFASLLTPDVDAGPALGHAVLTLFLASAVVVLAGATSADDPDTRPPGRFGVIELATILGLVGAVLALFVVSQLVALTDAGDRLVASAGLTPAEYARSGFFQLCWATGLLLAFLAVVRALAAPAALRHPVVVVLGATVPALALGLVVVSLRRMAVYDDAFGLTMLRLWVIGAALWMGAVLIMTAARNLGVGADRDWLVAGAGAAALVLVLAADVADAEAFVARHNLDRAQGGAQLDVGYLASLSDDATPVIAAGMEREVDPARREALRQALRCGEDAGGAASLNVAARRAADVRGDHCGGGTG